MSESEHWRPSASLQTLRARAELLAQIRDFFRQAGVLEVETPACSRFGVTDPAIESFTTRYTGPGAARGAERYLHTSPEFPMKRLLAAGSGPIYQLCRVFRNGEQGRLHNPEFTLLEWYRPGFDHHTLMDEVGSLMRALLPQPVSEQRLSYAEAFRRYLQIDPHSATPTQLRDCALAQGIAGAESLSLAGRDAWLDLLLSHCIEPHLGADGLCFLYDYPASQAALARVRPGEPAVAERFELYMSGVELANGFHELTHADEQRRRFQRENQRRRSLGLAQVPQDDRLLAALAAGMPRCAGVALGVDRLLMILQGIPHIQAAMAFDEERA
jgi:lysyl-tRNA synthetase class 2